MSIYPSRSNRESFPDREENLENGLIGNVPPEILVKILSDVDHPRIGQVCNQWRTVSKDESVNKELLSMYGKSLQLRPYLPPSMLKKPDDSSSYYEKVRAIRERIFEYARLPPVAKALENIPKDALFSLSIEALMEKAEPTLKNMDLVRFFEGVCTTLLNPENKLMYSTPEAVLENLKQELKDLKEFLGDNKISLEEKAGFVRWWIGRNKEGLSQITGLTFEGLKLFTLPPEIASFTGLKELYLSGNNFTILPSEIGSLTSLEMLYLNNNQLKELPPAIGSLTNLDTLDLNNNQLEKLPPAIGSLSSLRVLHLDNNQLKELPLAIGSLSSLWVLHLNNNQLEELSPAIGSLTNLGILYLNNNQLKELPPAIGSLTNLEILYLNNNQLKELPPAIGSLSSLRILNLKNNQLKELPLTIGSLTNLYTLDLDDNQLKELSEKIRRLTRLKTLFLYNNWPIELAPPKELLNALRANGTKVFLHESSLLESLMMKIMNTIFGEKYSE